MQRKRERERADVERADKRRWSVVERGIDNKMKDVCRCRERQSLRDMKIRQ